MTGEYSDTRGNRRGKGRGRGRGRGRGNGGGRKDWHGRKRESLSYQNKRENGTDEANDKRSSSIDSKNSCCSQSKDKVFSYAQMIPESDLGITEYISKQKRINGLLKQRYSDFIVHEVDPEGNIVKLTNLEVPVESEDSYDCEKDSIISDDIWQQLTKLLEKQKESEGNCSEVKIDVTEMNKDSRRNMHTAIKKVFGKKLQSNTIDQDGIKFMVVKKWTGFDSRGNWTRGKDQEYLHFVVHKEDMDTSETVYQISQRLRFKPSNLNFAGTKDRRACTSQKMSLWHGEPKRIRNLKIKNVWIGNYEFKPHTMKLGLLKGNLFSIALRNISNTDEEVDLKMISLKENGFLNYFGTQRFGTNKEAPTHAVGKALLQGDWEKAVRLILHPRKKRCGIEEAVECWWKEKDGKKALSLVKGSRSSVEVSLLKGLAEAGKNDYLKALNKLPRNLRLLYLHAYQSFVWNRVVSRRVQRFGLQTLPGDLVLIDSDADGSIADGSIADMNVNMIAQQSLVDENEQLAQNEPSDDSRVGQEGAKVRLLSCEEAKARPVSDVVLPTPGFKVILPENALKDWYYEMLAEDGLTIESLRQKNKEYSVGGSYRKVISKPSQLDWKILRYKEPSSPLLRTDPEELQGIPEPKDDPEGKFRALVVNIELDTSTYATMALREVVDYIGAYEINDSVSRELTVKGKDLSSIGNADAEISEPASPKSITNPNKTCIKIESDGSGAVKRKADSSEGHPVEEKKMKLEDVDLAPQNE